MDFTFSEEQDALRDAVRAFMADWVGAVRRARRARRRRLARARRPRLDRCARRRARSAGSGLGLVDAVVVLEEMGRVAFPGPYLSSLVAADARATPRCRTTSRAAIARGDVGTVALEESGARRPGGAGPHPCPAVGRACGRSPARSRSCSTVPVRRGCSWSPARPTGSPRSGSTSRTSRSVPTHRREPTRRAPGARRDAGGPGRTARRPHRDLARRGRRHRGRTGRGAHRRVRRLDRDGDELRRAARAVRSADRVRTR